MSGLVPSSSLNNLNLILKPSQALTVLQFTAKTKMLNSCFFIFSVDCTNNVECLNGGTCSRGASGNNQFATCACLPGFSGLMCEVIEG